MDFWKFPLFMSEQASISVGAVSFFMELFAELGLIPCVLRFFAGLIHSAMCKLALASVPAMSQLSPILALLRLVLGFVHFERCQLLLLLACSLLLSISVHLLCHGLSLRCHLALHLYIFGADSLPNRLFIFLHGSEGLSWLYKCHPLILHLQLLHLVVLVLLIVNEFLL